MTVLLIAVGVAALVALALLALVCWVYESTDTVQSRTVAHRRRPDQAVSGDLLDAVPEPTRSTLRRLRDG